MVYKLPQLQWSSKPVAKKVIQQILPFVTGQKENKPLVERVIKSNFLCRELPHSFVGVASPYHFQGIFSIEGNTAANIQVIDFEVRVEGFEYTEIKPSFQLVAIRDKTIQTWNMCACAHAQVSDASVWCVCVHT